MIDSQRYIKEGHRNFFNVAESSLAEISASLINLALSFDHHINSDTEHLKYLDAILKNIKKIRIGSTLCSFDDVTEMTFILEFLLMKVIENKLKLTQSRISNLMKVNDALKMQLDSLCFDIPVDDDHLNYIQTLLNHELSQVTK
ncbi:hypothetical protein [Methylotenera sp.]|uniref:hypothetical protein n=1 Tax=Methylotenera sp. TaxID=2051956 RepID=UPI002735002D|nr:hypothetical protein [Methylotenera sp.]MDP3211795.1 hypothetical protein [Methylotenera sp.]